MAARTLCATLVVLGAAALLAPAPAGADLASLKGACAPADALDNDVSNGLGLSYLFCDDGVPPVGGRTPNRGAVAAVAVPQRYDGYAGLPPKIAPDPDAGADADGNIALDVDVSLPDPARFPAPPGGYPLIAFMHGCCAGDKRWPRTVDAGGEGWHYSPAWFASRGYVALAYTARGFVNGQDRGSTGESRLDSRRYEINDFQHLAGQLADDPFFNVDGERVVVTGGSYGAGWSWLALTDPTWRSPGGRAMRLAAVAPKYGWTDLVESLIPNGSELRDRPPATDGSSRTERIGFPKQSIVASLFASGRTGTPSTSSPSPFNQHTTFPADFDATIACLEGPDPYTANPFCGGTLREFLAESIADRSAYYQNEFFERIRTDRAARVPIFAAGALTDPLFPMREHRRMAERLRSVVPDYPIQEHYGDVQHFVQNKSREWSDVCGADRHVCRVADYPDGDLDGDPAGRVRVGTTTRLNEFIDHFAQPPGNPDQPAPRFDVTAALQICPENASGVFPPNEPGQRFTARSFGALAPATLRLELAGSRTTTSLALPNPHARNAEPVLNQLANGGRCPVETSEAGPGVAVYTSDPIAADATMIGATRVTVRHTGSGGGVQLNSRLYDVFPDGRSVMVDRGVHVPTGPTATSVFELHGAGWRFAAGHRVRIELAQDDAGYIKPSTQPSSLAIAGVTLELPVREQGPSVSVDVPALAPPRFRASVTPDARERLGIEQIEVETRRGRGAFRPAGLAGAEPMALRAPPGGVLEIRARAMDVNGAAGPWARAVAAVPLDDSTRSARYRGGWRRLRAAAAYGGRLMRSSRRGDRVRLRFRGTRVDIVGRTGPRGGRAVVLLDGRRRLVSFFSRSTRDRRVVATLRARGRRVHVLELRNAGRGARSRVELDAFAVRP